MVDTSESEVESQRSIRTGDRGSHGASGHVTVLELLTRGQGATY